MNAQLNRKVLLLNASYEPLGAISVPRAVLLIWKEAAQMVERDGDRVLRSQHFEFEQPSVVRLIAYIDVRGRRRDSSAKRMKILIRDRLRCQYCGVNGTPFSLTLDHILPSSKGGTNAPDNLATACLACNQRKGDRTPEEARMPLLKNPAALVYGIDREILRREAKHRPEWQQYLFMGKAEVA